MTNKKIIFGLIGIALIIGLFYTSLYLMSSPKPNLIPVIFLLADGEDNEINHQNPCWSPNSSKILFSSTNGSDTLNMWVMNNDSTNAHPLFGEIDADADYVHLPGGAWCSATGEICFSSDREDNDEIWYVESDCQTLVRVTHNLSKDWEPSWSPDGEWLVFQSDRTGNWEIFKIRKNGTDLEQLTNNPAQDWQPAWSPDGSKILFQSDRSGNWQLYTIDNSSIESNRQDISNNNTYEDTDASWNPDGEYIVFSTDRSGNDADIYIMKKDGTDKTQITNHPQYDGAPSFAPNNQTIAFESLRSGEMRLWTVNLTNLEVSQLTY
ncbi:MAG: TolB family protein [Promethearchaeota archaeon]